MLLALNILASLAGALIGSFLGYWLIGLYYAKKAQKPFEPPKPQPKRKKGLRVVVRDDQAIFHSEQKRKGIA